MIGNETIAKILQEEYDIKDLTPYEEIDYVIEHFTDKISRVKITSKTDRSFCCPVYAMFDGYHMSWYGDYGAWVFSCTWETNVMNLAYNSPYYQLEKLESRERSEFNEQECAKNLLKEIKEGDWYNYDLSDEQKKRFDEYITATLYDFIFFDDVLYEYEDICETLKDLYNAASDKFDWISTIRNCDFDEDLNNVFNCEGYELYNIGDKAPVRYFIILYMLSVVANLEKAKRSDTE